MRTQLKLVIVPGDADVADADLCRSRRSRSSNEMLDDFIIGEVYSTVPISTTVAFGLLVNAEVDNARRLLMLRVVVGRAVVALELMVLELPPRSVADVALETEVDAAVDASVARPRLL
jgi:hypothetical protein